MEIFKVLDKLKANEIELARLQTSIRSAGQDSWRFLEASEHLFAEGPMTPGRTIGGLASRFGAVTGRSRQETVSKEEHEKEKQRLEALVGELEARLEKAAESNEQKQRKIEELQNCIRDLELTREDLSRIKQNLDIELTRIRSQQSNLAEDKTRQRPAVPESLISRKASKDACCQTIASPSIDVNNNSSNSFNKATLDEFERLKQQHLECSKTIAAMKQAAMEKDRKMDQLHQKLKRSRKHHTSGSREDDVGSLIGSELSQSTNSLDTILEDWEELAREEVEESYRHLAREHLELKRAFALANSVRSNADNNAKEADLARAFNKISSEDTGGHAESQAGRSSHPLSPVDTNWIQEKLRYTSLVKSLQERVAQLEETQEKLQAELDDSKEQSELLEFKMLELENGAEMLTQPNAQLHHHSETKANSNNSRIRIDRSVGTSDDCTAYSPVEEDLSAIEESLKDIPLNELKIRLTLLKHRKELKPVDRLVIIKAKEVLETLQSHSECTRRFVEFELKLREVETESAKLKKEKEELENIVKQGKEKQTKLEKKKELKKEIDRGLAKIASLERNLAIAQEDLMKSRQEVQKLNYMSCISSDNDKRNKQAVADLQRQLQNVTGSREAEIKVLSDTTKSYSQELESFRNKVDQLEAELAKAKQENQSHVSVINDTKSAESLKTTNAQLLQQLSEKAVQLKRTEQSLAELSKEADQLREQLKSAENQAASLDANRQHLNSQLNQAAKSAQKSEAKYQDMKQKLKESLAIIRDYESTDKVYQMKLRQAAEEMQSLQDRVIQQEEQLQEASIEKANAKSEIKRLEQQLAAAKKKSESLRIGEFGADLPDQSSASEHRLSLMEKQICDLNAYCNCLKEVINDQHLKLQEAEKRELELSEKLAEANGESNEPINNDSSSEFVSQLQAKLASAESYSGQLETQFQLQINTCYFLKDQLVSTNAKLKLAETNLETLKAEKQQLQALYEAASAKLEDQNLSQKDFNSEVSSEIQSLSQTLDRLRMDLQYKTQEASQLKAHLDAAHSCLGNSSLSAECDKPKECCIGAQNSANHNEYKYIRSIETQLVLLREEFESILATSTSDPDGISQSDSSIRERLGGIHDACIQLCDVLDEKAAIIAKRQRNSNKICHNQNGEATDNCTTKGLLSKDSGYEQTALSGLTQKLQSLARIIQGAMGLCISGREPKQDQLDPGASRTECQELHMPSSLGGPARTSSPLENSGTESELFGKSPVLQRLSLTTDPPRSRHAPRGGRISPTGPTSPGWSGSISEGEERISSSSSHNDDTESISTTSPVRPTRANTKTRKFIKHKKTSTSGIAELSFDLTPPSDLKLLGKLDPNSWLIGWTKSSDFDLASAEGYKIYIDKEPVQVISDLNACKSVIAAKGNLSQSVLSITTYKDCVESEPASIRLQASDAAQAHSQCAAITPLTVNCAPPEPGISLISETLLGDV